MFAQAYLALLRFTDIAFSTSLCLPSLLARFSNSICSLCVSMSHFGNSHDISRFFIITTFAMVTVISDLEIITTTP